MTDKPLFMHEVIVWVKYIYSEPLKTIRIHRNLGSPLGEERGRGLGLGGWGGGGGG